MRKLKTREYEEDCRIAGKFNNEKLAIARAVTTGVMPHEQPHFHAQATEYYMFFRGRAEMKVNDLAVAVSAGDVIVVEPGEVHCMTKVIEEIDYLTIRDSVEDDKVVANA